MDPAGQPVTTRRVGHGCPGTSRSAHPGSIAAFRVDAGRTPNLALDRPSNHDGAPAGVDESLFFEVKVPGCLLKLDEFQLGEDSSNACLGPAVLGGRAHADPRGGECEQHRRRRHNGWTETHGLASCQSIPSTCCWVKAVPDDEALSRIFLFGHWYLMVAARGGAGRAPRRRCADGRRRCFWTNAD